MERDSMGLEVLDFQRRARRKGLEHPMVGVGQSLLPASPGDQHPPISPLTPSSA